VLIKDENSKAKVLKFQLGARLYNDRSTVMINKDVLLNNAEYIQCSTNLRSSVANELLSFDVTDKGTIYIAYDPTYTTPDWLVNEFEKTGKELIIDKLSYQLFRKQISSPQKLVLGGNHKGVLPVKSGVNYIVFFVK